MHSPSSHCLDVGKEQIMASLQQKGDRWYCQFVYQGKHSTFSVGDVSRQEAEAKASQVDYLLLRLKQRLITIPHGMSTSSNSTGEPSNFFRQKRSRSTNSNKSIWTRTRML
jgi:hypothetical protein